MHLFGLARLKPFANRYSSSAPTLHCWGSIGDKQHNFMFQHCYSGAGDEFAVRCWFFATMLSKVVELWNWNYTFTFNHYSKRTNRLVSSRVYRLTSHFGFTNLKLITRISITCYRRILLWIVGHLWISPNHSSVGLTWFSVNSLIVWTGNHWSFMICISL